MPSCFQLIRKGDTEPSVLQHVDKVLCQNLDLPYSDRVWTYGWYDDIGLCIAMGKTLPELIDLHRMYVESDDPKYTQYRVHELAMWRIAAYLNEHYTTDAWWEPKH